jgi:HEPN domain-containing protein
MIDIAKQITYWRESAQEDWDVARELVHHGRIQHGLFLVHLALEKALKALVCRHTRDLAPKLHNLSRLAELTGLPLPWDYGAILADVNMFQLEGRYPESLTTSPTKDEALLELARAEKVYQWLMQQ